MAHKKISRNDPCPCGSGKKFKHCCIGKDIDGPARQSAGIRRPIPPAPRPRAALASGFASLGPFRIVDAKLKEIARATHGSADWKAAVVRVSDTSPDEERIAAYKAIRDARVLPEDAAIFLFGHGVQWMTSEEKDPDRHMMTLLRRFGLEDLADLYASTRLEYERRHERGRQFFFGPPDELLAERLRERGIID